MSWLSHAINKVLPGSPTQSITGVLDKYLFTPKTKDAWEAGATALAMPFAVGAVAPAMANMLGSATLGSAATGALSSIATGGNPLLGALFGGLTNLGQAPKVTNEFAKGWSDMASKYYAGNQATASYGLNNVLKNALQGYIQTGSPTGALANVASGYIGATGALTNNELLNDAISGYLQAKGTGVGTGAVGALAGLLGNVNGMSEIAKYIPAAYETYSQKKGEAAAQEQLNNLFSQIGAQNTAVGTASPTTGNSILDSMLAAAKYKQTELRKETLRDLENQMARRGLRTSGIHQAALLNTAKKLETAADAENNAIALDVFKTQEASRLADIQNQLQLQQIASQQSIANQQNRANMTGALGGLLGTIFAPSLQGLIADKWNVSGITPQSYASSNYMTPKNNEGTILDYLSKNTMVG